MKTLFGLYNKSIYGMLHKVYPEYEWLPWKFVKLPQGLLHSESILEAAVNYAAKSLKITSPEQWYEVSLNQLNAIEVGRFFAKNGGIFNVLKRFRPSFEWEPWKFSKITKGLSLSPDLIEMALQYVEKKFEIVSPELWYRVSVKQLMDLGVYSFFLRNGGIFEVLKRFRPNFEWNETKFIGIAAFGENLLGASLRTLFSDIEIIPNHLLRNGSEECKVSFSLPTLRLAFDFQADKYYGLKYSSGKVEVQLIEDTLKAEISRSNGIDLLFIPFWWDRSLSSLGATIMDRRPDLTELLITRLSELHLSPSNPIPTNTSVELSKWRRRGPAIRQEQELTA